MKNYKSLQKKKKEVFRDCYEKLFTVTFLKWKTQEVKMLIKIWNEKTIRWREDGYGCLTDIAKATGKKVNDWIRLKSTNEFLERYSLLSGIPVTHMLQVFQGGQENEQGTWANQEICIEFARWCNVDFRITVMEWVKEIMTKGYVDIRNLTTSVAKTLGREATRVCKEHNVPVEKVNDPRFGYVGSYPEEILKDIFKETDI